MIMMRSSSVTKMPKPPPPVPPRPSKTLVAEALAKTRKKSPELPAKPTPIRAAPPPPVPANRPSQLAKSQSTAGVDVVLKKPAPYERSISEEAKISSRTVIFQSSNIGRNHRNDAVAVSNGGGVSKREPEFRTAEVRKVPSFNSNRDQPLLTQRKLNKTDSFSRTKLTSNENGVIKINTSFDSFDARKIAVKENNNDSANKGNSDPPMGNPVKKSNSFKVATANNISLSNGALNSTLNIKSLTTDGKVAPKSNGVAPEKEIKSPEEDTVSIISESPENTDENGKWNEMLNDRNHVNTLIDEMFASVLEVSEQTDKINTKSDVVISTDKNKITISNTNSDITSSDTSSVKSHRSDSIASTTVLILSGDSDSNQDVVERPERKMSESNTEDESKSNSSTGERKKVKFDDKMNHELLISELQDMKKEHDRILKRQRKPSMNIYKKGESDKPNIQRSDWVEVSDGQEVKLSRCQITIEEMKNKDNANLTLDYERISTMSSLHGLPPLPKSLSGFSLLENHNISPPTPVRTTSARGGSASTVGHLVYPPHPKHPSAVNGATDSLNINSDRKSTNLDTQLAILRREMYSLRQLDLSLLSQLWSLNESIQDFRQILQDQEDRILSPPSPSPTPSSADEGDPDEFYMSPSSVNFRPIAPPVPVRRPSASSNASSLG